MTFNPVRHALEKILVDRKNRSLPLLTAEDYTPFLKSIEALLKNPVFMHEHNWETQTLEHSINRPTFNAKNPEDCESKLDVRLREGEERDARGTVVFDGSVISVIVDGYVLAKGRSTLSAGDALVDVFQKVVNMARERE